MKELTPVIIDDERLATTDQLAIMLDTTIKNIRRNFDRNRSKFKEGRDYVKLNHSEINSLLKSSFGGAEQAIDYKGNKGKTFWTEKGLVRHAKILTNDASWMVTDTVIEGFFDMKRGNQLPKIPQLPQSFSEALLLAGKLEQEKEQALKTIERKDKLLLISNDSSIQVGDIKVGEFVKGAYGIHIGANTFYKWMRKEGYVFKKSTQPIQEYVNRGWFTYKPTRGNNGKYYNTLLITPKGKLLLAEAYSLSLKENKPSTNFNLN